MEPDEVHVLATPVPGYREQIGDALEAGGTCELGSDVAEGDRLDRVDLDLSAFHPISLPRSDVRTSPHTNAAGDLAAPHSIAQVLGELHARSLVKRQRPPIRPC